ncbi:hypothetical protein BLEM_0610 [Bifidobacterium lemurum]|uniref:Uncharacterized protein n=1 Tax=Bifidobacterium lemurum TaxID=1603886 RepID=A0A261FUT6_9BIFI|nr:hypothetical protein [Bifidobacterium lemurum]OZG62693.1 hypothetical protein BLEM_0610 [Bifidobacterium lemurum]QOL34590.1 hypothetical protein BL8807_01250 [Bifidobacterium lemurum]
MSTTSLYGLYSPDPSDLVSEAPEQFAQMCQSIETALHEIDQRATPEGTAPVIAQTYEALAGMTGVIGQTGYVTADATESLNGPYVWSGSVWTRVWTRADADTDMSPVDCVPSNLASYGTCTVVKKQGWVHMALNWKSSASASWGSGDIGTVPEGYRPPWRVEFSPVVSNEVNNKMVYITTDGKIGYSNRGGAQDSTGFSGNFSWPLA